MMTKRDAGFTLLELLMALLVSSMIAFVGIPPMLRWADGLRMHLAAAEVSSALHLARQYAIRNNQNVAIKFERDAQGVVTFALYRDMDFDGVRNADIRAGTDLQVTPHRPLSYMGTRIRFGFPPGMKPLAPGNTGQLLERLDDPIRFNRSDLASFSSHGTATPGTLYLTDGIRQLAAVRVANRSGKITTLHYDPDQRRWR